jgi:hypothetical protein
MKILLSTRKRRVSVQLPFWRTPEESSPEVVGESPKGKRFLGFLIHTTHIVPERHSHQPLSSYSTDDVCELHELPVALDLAELPASPNEPELHDHSLMSELDNGGVTSALDTLEEPLGSCIPLHWSSDFEVGATPSYKTRVLGLPHITLPTPEAVNSLRGTWHNASFPLTTVRTSYYLTPEEVEFVPVVSCSFNPSGDAYQSPRLNYQPSDGDPYAGLNSIVDYSIHSRRRTSKTPNPVSISETSASTDTAHCSPCPIELPTASNSEQSSRAPGSLTLSLFEKTSQDLVKRSMSTPLTLAMLHSLFEPHLDGDCPARSASAPHPQEQEHHVSIDSGQSGAALNGVSLYYASRNKTFTIEPDGTKVVQLTNSQKIRRRASFNGFMGSCDANTLNNIMGTLSLSDSLREAILMDLPFADLLRSRSLENPALYQSVQQLKHTKKMMNEALRPRHRFRGGRISGSGKGRVRRAAYPPLKCDQCRGVFDGNDRKRKLARHRRKVHACGSIKLNLLPVVQYPTLICEHCHMNFTGVQAKEDVAQHTRIAHAASTQLLWETQAYIPWASERVSQPPAEYKPHQYESQQIHHHIIMSCSSCATAFQGEYAMYNLKQHEIAFHGTQELYFESQQIHHHKTFSCGSCEKVFHGKYAVGNLRRHEMAFHAKRPRQRKGFLQNLDNRQIFEWEKTCFPKWKARQEKRDELRNTCRCRCGRMCQLCASSAPWHLRHLLP